MINVGRDDHCHWIARPGYKKMPSRAKNEFTTKKGLLMDSLKEGREKGTKGISPSVL
jgi:hypothetical protein